MLFFEPLFNTYSKTDETLISDAINELNMNLVNYKAINIYDFKLILFKFGLTDDRLLDFTEAYPENFANCFIYDNKRLFELKRIRLNKKEWWPYCGALTIKLPKKKDIRNIKP